MNNIPTYHTYLHLYSIAKKSLADDAIYECALCAKSLHRLDLIYEASVLQKDREKRAKILILALEVEDPETPIDRTGWVREDALWKAYDAIVIDAWYTKYSSYTVPAYDKLMLYHTFPSWAETHIKGNKTFVDAIKTKNEGTSKFMSEIQNLQLEKNKVHIHFIYIKKRDFMLTHWLAVQTARFYNPEKEIIIYNDIEPVDNYWWDRTKTIAKVVKITPPEIINNSVINFPQHVADVIRLYVLKIYGGYYFDLDLLSNKNIDPISSSSKVVLPRESAVKLCNCFIFSPYPEHPFICKWWERYNQEYGSHPDFWAGLSTMVPKEIADESPELVEIIPTELVLPFDFYDRNFFIWEQDVKIYKDAYTIHLWDTEAIKRGDLPEYSSYFFRENTPFAKIFRKFL